MFVFEFKFAKSIRITEKQRRKIFVPWQESLRVSPILQHSSCRIFVKVGRGPDGVKESAGFREPSLLPFPTTCTWGNESIHHNLNNFICFNWIFLKLLLKIRNNKKKKKKFNSLITNNLILFILLLFFH